MFPSGAVVWRPWRETVRLLRIRLLLGGENRFHLLADERHFLGAHVLWNLIRISKITRFVELVSHKLSLICEVARVVVVSRFILFKNVGRYKIFDRLDIVVHIELSTIFGAGESTNNVVTNDNVALKALEHKVERVQRADAPTGGDVDVDSERTDAVRVQTVGVSVSANVALI